MNIYFISNGVWEFDGRLRELLRVTSNIGAVKYITRVNDFAINNDHNHIKITNKSYFYFVIRAIVEGLKNKQMEIIFVDNRKAIIPALIINLIKKPNRIILDVRELYLSKEVKHLVGKVGCFFESIMIKKADIVICANKFRAEKMKDFYNLLETPLVYENVRQINYSEETNFEKLKNKYKHIFSKKSIKIISTSGYSVSRTNDKLVESMTVLGDKYDLILVGGGSIEDKRCIEDIMRTNNLNNVHLIEMVKEDELKFLISNSQIGIVNYHQNDLNNRLCASGKIYEFIFEGLPVVTTENMPLVDFCVDFGVGCSDDSYIKGINKVVKEYSSYKKQVEKIRMTFDVAENNFELQTKIIERLSKLEKEYQ